MKLICGDSLTELKKLDAGIVQTCVTSPPYWGLRDYGTAEWKGGEKKCTHKRDNKNGPSTLQGQRNVEGSTGDGIYKDVCAKCGAERIDAQLGLEKTPEEYVAKMVEIFREVRRVLRNDGTLWLNLGDSFASGKGTCYNPGGGETSLGKERKGAGAHPLDRGNKSSLKKSGLKPKDLVGIPWMVAFALRADGWYLRSDIIWSKPNPMPESTTDRPTKSHEYIFLLAKSGKALFWTHRDTGEGVRVHPEPDYRWVHKDTSEETAEPQSDKKKWRRINLWRGHDYYYDADAIREPHQTADREGKRGSYKPGSASSMNEGEHISKSDAGLPLNPAGRNKRSVWEITTQPFPEAHFAVFPPKLIEPCVLAGSASKACAKCGAAWSRHTEPAFTEHDGVTHTRYKKGSTAGRLAKLRQAARERGEEHTSERKTIGFQPTCKCNADSVSSIVLDPFFGSGTTGLVAVQKDRDYIGIELNPEYVEMAKKRLRNLQPEMFV